MGYAESQKPMDFEPSWLENINLNLYSINKLAKSLSTDGPVTGTNRLQWAIRALQLTDLTTLAGDDTQVNVNALCVQAVHPFSRELLHKFDLSARTEIHTAAVCVYPSRVRDAHSALERMDKLDTIQIAAVATGFPSGQYPLASRLLEIECAIQDGATEIDIVVDRSLVLENRWPELYAELVAMRRACGDHVHMKSILAIGECGTMENVYKASLVAMMAGSDFIKTSTGKESVNATLPVGLVMMWAIREFHLKTGRRIGFKPAGGVRSVDDAVAWLTLLKNTLGSYWVTPNLFRFGASGLVNNIEKYVESGCRESQH